jgi:hypothetical protein
MKHAGKDSLDRIEPLLSQIRGLKRFNEKSRGVFYAKSRAALHFHEDPAGVFADVRRPGEAEFERFRIDDPAGQAALLARLQRSD